MRDTLKVVEFIDLASWRSTWEVGRSHGEVSERTEEAVEVRGVGHGAIQAVPEVRKVGTVK